jgi:hypothetical protein
VIAMALLEPFGVNRLGLAGCAARIREIGADSGDEAWHES